MIQYRAVQKLGHFGIEEDENVQDGAMQIEENGQEEGEEVQAIEYKQDEGQIVDERFSEEEVEAQELIKSESFRLKTVRKELIKTQK